MSANSPTSHLLPDASPPIQQCLTQIAILGVGAAQIFQPLTSLRLPMPQQMPGVPLSHLYPHIISSLLFAQLLTHHCLQKVLLRK